MKRVLLFDSGVGGLSIHDAIVRRGVGVRLDYLADNAWLPYGLKAPSDLARRVPMLIEAAVAANGADAVVIACNTATTIALAAVRAVLTIPVIGVAPPIKPAAAASRSGVIGLLATPATVATAYVDGLVADFAADRVVIRHGCADLVSAAEEKLATGAADLVRVRAGLAPLFAAPGGDAIDVVALACTHFPLLLEELGVCAPRAVTWLDSGEAIARRLEHVLGLAAGGVLMGKAVFTDATGAQRVAGAFATRGYGVRLDADFTRASALFDA